MTVQSFDEFLADPDRLSILPRPHRSRMSSVEILEEAEFLVRGGVAPHDAARTLGVAYNTLMRYTGRLNRPDLAELFETQNRYHSWDAPHGSSGASKRASRATTPPRVSGRVTEAHSRRAS